MTLLSFQVFVSEKEGSVLSSAVFICVGLESLRVLRMGRLCCHISATVLKQGRWGRRGANQGTLRLPWLSPFLLEAGELPSAK